jgi:hypothetical protein
MSLGMVKGSHQCSSLAELVKMTSGSLGFIEDFETNSAKILKQLK